MGIRVFSGGGSGGGVWGTITGTLADQTDLNTALGLKAPLASPTFTGTVTIPTPFTLGAVSVTPTGTELNFVDGVTSGIQGQLDLKAAILRPALTGNVSVGRTTANLTGTVTTNGTTTITGSGTLFLTELDVGDTVNISGETSRVVSTIASNTSLVLTVAASTSASGLTYSSTAITPITVGANGRVVLPAGTATKPAIGFLLDDDGAGTGFYRSGANTWSYATNGTQRLEFAPGTTTHYGQSMGGGGGSIFVGFVRNIINRTSDAAEAGTNYHSVITNAGATGLVTRTLPAAAVGGNYTFYCADADGLKIAAAAGDDIRVIDKVTATAGYISSTTIGSVVTLVAIDGDHWVATSIHGVWTDGTFTYDDTSLTTP